MKSQTRGRASRLVVVGLLAVAATLGFFPGLLAGLPLVMGVTAQTSDLDELMKYVFDDTLISEVVTDSEFLAVFPDGEVKKGSDGRWFETAQLYKNPGSIGSRAEGQYIPESVPGAALNSRINLKKVMGSLEETGEVMKRIRGDKAAFVDWAEEQFPLFQESLRDELDRQAISAGTGIRARVNMATPTTSLVIDSSMGIAGFDHQLMQFRRGMSIRIGPNANGSSLRANAALVNEVDWDNQVLTLSALPTSTANNDYIFEGDAAGNSAGNDMMGALGLIDNGGIVQTLQNIDRNTYLWFRSYVQDVQATHGSGTPISEDVLINVDMQASLRGGGQADVLIISVEGYNQVWGDIKADRVVNDPRGYTIGRNGITVLFGGTRRVMLKTARKLPSKICFGIQRDQLRKFILHEWEWDDLSGSIWKQVTDSTGRKDAHYCYGSMYGQLGIKSPQKCWRAENWA